MKIVSFDYSITSPAMTIFDTETMKFESHFISSSKKCQPKYEIDSYTFYSHIYPIWTKQPERYEKLSEVFISILEKVNDKMDFYIEDYSFGSKGRVFHIAENTGVLKYKIFKKFNSFCTEIPPTVIKKHYTGKGNSNKEAMAETFYGIHHFKMHEFLECKLDGPAADLVDAIALNNIGWNLSTGEIALSDIFKKKAK